MTDKKIAKWVGVTTQTLRNWKRPQVLDCGTKFYPPYGKHNLYKSIRLGYYLLSYPTYKEDGQEFSEHSNKIEELSSLADSLVALLGTIKNNTIPKEVKDSAIKQAEDIAARINHGCNSVVNL